MASKQPTTNPNTIYIDSSSGTNGVGTIVDPKNTITGLTFQSNRIYRFKRGTTLDISTTTGWQSLSNITMASYGSGARPILRYTGTGNYGFYANGNTNITFSGIEFTAPNPTSMVAILNLGSSTGGVLGGTGITITDCKFTLAGTDSSMGMAIRGGGSNIVISNCLIDDISADGIYLVNTTNVEIAYNTITKVNQSQNSLSGGGDAIQLNDDWSNVWIHHNIIDRSDAQTENKFGIIVNNSSAPWGTNSGLLIEHNDIRTKYSVTSIALYIGTNIIIRFNKFTSPNGRGNHHIWVQREGIDGKVLGTVQIYMNSFKSTTYGIYSRTDVIGTQPTLTIYNNVFYDITGIHVWARNTTVTAKNNIHMRAADSGVAYGNEYGSTFVRTTNCYGVVGMAGITKEATAIEANPLFVDAANGDFHLQTLSPCRNAGVNVGITEDYDGILIPTLNLGLYFN